MSRRTMIGALVFVSLALAAGPALASKPGGSSTSSATCTAAGNAVTATGLPTNQLINFMVKTASGTTGWVLGFTSDGNWTVYTPTTTGTTYQFVSKTWGTDGSKYTVFASCAA